MLGFPIDNVNIQSQYGGIPNGMPPNPIGNIVNIGSSGYNAPPFNTFMNSPYYTNNYNYVNPYLVVQQQKAMEAARKEMKHKHIQTMQSISKRIHKSLGDIDDKQLEDRLKVYDPDYMTDDQKEKMESISLYNKLANLQPIIYTRQVDYSKINRRDQNIKQRFPDDMSLAQFLDKAGELYREALIDRNNRATKDGKKKYNSNDFNQLVDLHRSSSSYFNNVLCGNITNSIDIGDLEIRIPDGERPKVTLNMPSKVQEYAMRKQAFIQACLNSDKRNPEVR